MGSDVVKVLRQGVWGSLSGGWYYDPRHSKFANVFHLYAWLILLCLPFVFYLVPTFQEPWAVIVTYGVTIFALFAGIKITNYRLHSMFDKGDPVNKKTIPADNQNIAVDHLVSEENTSPVDWDQPTVADAFPVAGSTEVLERREENENIVEVHKEDDDPNCKGDGPEKPVTKRDLEVDVHVDLTNVKIHPKSAAKETQTGLRKKKRRDRRRARPQKSVAFVDGSLSRERRLNIGRCASLSSASSDSDNTDDDAPSTNTDSSGDTDSDDAESSDPNGDFEKDGHATRHRQRRTRMIKRRAGIRGHTKHPWYSKSRPKTALGNHEDDKDELDSDTSSAGSSQSSISMRRKHTSGERSNESSQHKKLPSDREAREKPVDVVEIPQVLLENTLTQENKDENQEKDAPTSDQELLARDPVWRARRSQRYSSDRRLPFFRRRSYTVNSIRSNRRDDRRRLSTVPPYNGRRSSPSRRPGSSLQKLLSMWSRDPVPSLSQGDDAPSPGQISPGQIPVVLTGHSVDNTVFLDTNKPSTSVSFFPPNIEDLPSDTTSGKLDVSETNIRGRNRSESGSHNSNPHCNEMSGASPKAGGDCDKPTSSKSSQGKERKTRPRKPKRSHTSSNPPGPTGDARADFERMDEHYRALYGMTARPPSSDLLATSHRKSCPESNEDDSEDMNKFVTNLLGAQASWQGAQQANTSSIDPETGAKEIPFKSKIPVTSLHIQNNRDVSAIDGPSLDKPSASLPSTSSHSNRARHSLTTLSLSTNDASGQRHARNTALRFSVPPGRTRSNSGRRVRHPAGNSGSHSRLTSNTSEEGVMATSQQISANSFTSTTELLGNIHDDIPPEVVEKLGETENDASAHIATEHDDTTAGATHAFQDEYGNWLTYTFGESSGTAHMLSAASTRRTSRSRNRLITRYSLQSGDTSDEAKSPPTSRREHRNSGNSGRRITFPSITRRLNSRTGRNELSNFLEESDLSGSFTQAESPEISPLDFILNSAMIPPRRPITPKVKLYYKFNFLPCKSIILQYDRLALHDLLDRNRHLFENIFSVLLAIIVAILGFILLQRGFFFDFWLLWFCAVIATAQYSLIRSVQPDSASPTHGHNRTIAYSRPIYFCILALLILLFDYLVTNPAYQPDTYLYANMRFTKESCILARSILIFLIMTLPFISLLGLLPQMNTFIMYLAEQIDIHMFGGTACTGLLTALYSLLRSFIACCLLFGFCYGGMKTEEKSQHILFSVFCGLLISFSYHLSRQTNNPLHLWKIIKSKFLSKEDDANKSNAAAESADKKDIMENPDEISSIYVQTALCERLQSDLFVCPLIAIFLFAIHCSTAFTELQPSLSLVLYIIAGVLGLFVHYILPQLRKQLPWLLFSCPILKAKEYGLFEVQEEAQVMGFEKVYVVSCFIERNIIYPLVIMNELTRDAPSVIKLYGLVLGCILLTVIGLKLLRSSYNVTLLQYAALTFSVLFTEYDARKLQDSTLVTYFLVSIFIVKLQDMLLKLQFIYVYIAPWQITWGSAFHAFAQPFSVPHSGMLLLHTLVSSILHAPLAPFLGSAVFLTSYVRPLKFWERNYNTKRVDHSNTRLAAQIDRGPSSDDNNLNSIFYEHLTLSLQKSLCGDIAMGRWGNVYPGDCFIMASDYLNALVHIIQRGNGVITFQLRGLEFSGTYCQQREVEAISEGVDDNSGLCCCRPGHAKNMLSFNAAFSQRWLAWQVQTTKFILDGYSITDNSATSMLGVYDLRKILLSSMVKGVVYFLISHKSLEKWLNDEAILDAIKLYEVPDYVDIDPSFSVTIHDDYDMWLSGISRTKFQAVYGEWIKYCASKCEKPVEADAESKLVTLCFMISVLSRRALGTASSHLTASHVVLESFLYGLHSLFKGDFRITSSKDEWVFIDMDLLHHVVAPGVRMSLKLHQDHFQNLDDENNFEALHEVITENIKDMVITHEADPQWRRAVLSNRPSLLALRHVAGDAVDSYFVITLKRRSQGFRVVRVNKECVKGLWAGQQQELVFLRNSNPERGSIQNAKQVLRNMINSSCDQPIGYPIYVSPVTTSFSNTHDQYKKIVGGSMSLQTIRSWLSAAWSCLQRSCGGGCNSGGSAGIHIGADIARIRHPITTTTTTAAPPTQSVRTSVSGSQSSGGYQSQSNVPTAPTHTSSSVNVDNDQASVPQWRSSRSPVRSLSNENRKILRSNTDDYGGSENVFMSSSSLSGARSSSRWRTATGHHPSGSASIELKPINTRHLLAPGISTRGARLDGTGGHANSDTFIFKSSRSSLPTDEPRAGRSILTTVSGSGRRMHKSVSGITAASSSSSSMSRGDSITVIGGQLAPPKAVRKGSGDSVVNTNVKQSSRPKRTKKNTKDIGKEKDKNDQVNINEPEKEMVMITDPSRVFETLEVRRQVDYVKWPNEEWRKYGGRSKWGDWRPKKGMVGEVVFRWYPSHRDASQRSHVGEVIVLMKMEDAKFDKPFYVPIPEKGVTEHDTKNGLETTQL
uniref:pecanex-like protein 1 isoform X1 n=1 Tax=Styela clava TaxID=7725 RepID=UPI00193A193E|nr:pecanex-like protein 1 isoform X1 [Styela clava]